ncbi:MAG: DUF4124 domain-containing protein [Gammaproteobacteria bacterium]|nr:DUF4124 domain-containing protein [Gammaproteobacteria bacterium]
MRALALVIMVAVSPLTAAEIYKWVDEDGNVQFSSRKPPDQAVDKVEVKYAKPVPEAQEKLDNILEADKEARAERKEREAEAEQAAKKRAIKKDNCKRARANLAELQQSVRIYHTSEDGGRVRVGEEQRQADMARMQDVIDRDCK